jgi:hypothetical protein
MIFFSSQMNFDFEEDLRRELVGEFYEHVRQEIEQTIRKEIEAECGNNLSKLTVTGIIKQSEPVVIPIV